MTYTGISTAHKFTANGKPAKAVNVDTSVNSTVTVANFFDSVKTPDTISGETIHVTGVGVVPSILELDVNETATLNAQVIPANATVRTVTWSSSASSVASVSASGVVKGLTAGTATITATTTDGSFTDTCSVTVNE